MRQAIVCLAVMLVSTNVALAITPHIVLQAGLGTYEMKQANEVIRELNGLIEAPAADKIDGGSQFGLGIGMILEDGFLVELAYQRLNGKAETSASTGEFELNIPAHALLLRGLLPVSGEGIVQPQIGVAVGVISASGSLMVSDGSRETFDLSGQSFYFEGTLGVSVAATSNFLVELAAGYRHARIRNVLAEPLASGGLDLDYSGLTARLGLRLQL